MFMSEKKQVLIICHSSAGQMYLGVLLSRIWFSSILARTPDEGIRLARKSPFSLTLFDGELMETEFQTGITLLRTDPVLKNQPLVVFMTNDDPVKIQALLSQGCSAVLTKPLDLALMYGVLSRLCGQPRTTPRIAVKMRVEIAEGISKRVLTSVNLSEGGVYLRTLQPLPEGERLHIRFTLPHDAESIELHSEVVRTFSLSTQFEVEPGMGLRFVDIPQETLLKIRNFIQWEMIGDLEWNSGI
jgi:uncharacterized protein (TIGR02266 family)